MATLLLSAAGSAIGSGIGGSVLGLSGAVVGRAVGATIGRGIDQRVLGAGSEAVETGRIDRFHLNGVGYGTPIKDVWGRVRISGEIIWASRFQENRRVTGGGKGNPGPASDSFSYSVSLAIALCRGEARCVGRVWADGIEIALNSLNLRFYPGSDEQLPDPKIEVTEGVGNAPSYRGICYVVIEDLALSRFGNRVPQFSFEVIRSAKPGGGRVAADLASTIKAVTLIPGSGEYSLATKQVHFDYGLGRGRSANMHSIQGVTDFEASLNQLNAELPNCGAVSLVVSWFGSDLRCGLCKLQPKVEQRQFDGVEMPWNVSGVSRGEAELVPEKDGRPIYGGTPTDASVIEAIAAIRNSGKDVMFYPFILMDQGSGNNLPNPWAPAEVQPVLPWRGRITLSVAPGLPGSPDQTALADDEVRQFLGEAQRDHFAQVSGNIVYTGPQDWGFRRFILHYAHLCAAAGGVESFCIGSELRGLTQIRSSQDHFPMVEALRSLAADVKIILGSATKVSYAADWSEYFGYHVDGDVLFHLDSLWADPSIDFVGIDNYMPISDWREGGEHLDASWGSIYNIDYLVGNVGGGEGFDWYYDSPEGEAAQRRIAIVDEVYREDWVFRYKDLAGWWSNTHHNRINGARVPSATDWLPGMKPIVFTEYGCAALDKATNQPNLFLDPKSSESKLPRSSLGGRDDCIQLQYFTAMQEYWANPQHNPQSNVYEGRMVDVDKFYAWAWDARPFPDFPGNVSVWSDGLNYSRGHWLNGRTSNQFLPDVISEVCASSGLVEHINVGQLHGIVRGFLPDSANGTRGLIQTLMMSFDFTSNGVEGELLFRSMVSWPQKSLIASDYIMLDEFDKSLEAVRSPLSNEIGRVSVSYFVAESDFEISAAETNLDTRAADSSHSELGLVLTEPEAKAIAERWIAELLRSRESVVLTLPKSCIDVSNGDRFTLGAITYQIDRVEESISLEIIASRVDPRPFQGGTEEESSPSRVAPLSPRPVFATFLDLPLIRGTEIPYAPHIAVSKSPWSGTVGVWSSASDSNFILSAEVSAPAVLGITVGSLDAWPQALWDFGSVLRVEIGSGTLSSASQHDVLNGANAAAIGDGSAENWEVFQFSEAKLVGPNLYELSNLLRGVAGTEALMPAVRPPGSWFVLLDSLLPQVPLSQSSRGLARNYRVGSIDRGFSDQGVAEFTLAFQGNGLRPFSVSHLRARGSFDTGIEISWVRRTRIDGDSWQSIDVPLGEDSMSFTVRALYGTVVLREVIVSMTKWEYSKEMHFSDGAVLPITFTVAQNSASYGVGPERSIVVV